MATSMRTPSLSSSRSSTPAHPVQPDHFYNASSDGESPLHPPTPSTSGRTWLSPDDDPFATRGIPVFKPTVEEFADFEKYMESVECWGMRSGIVKVVPPKEWRDNLPPLNDKLASVRVRAPIEQHMLGRAGLYRQQNIEKRKLMSVREWADLCAKEDMQAPGVDDVELKSADAGERWTRRKRRTAVKEEKEDLVKVMVKEEEHEDALSTLDAPTPIPTVDEDILPQATPMDEDDSHCADSPHAPSPEPLKPGQKKRRAGQSKPERDAAQARRLKLNDEFLADFDPHSDWLPPNTSPHDYTPEFCSKLERRYWRNCGLGRAPWYGADTAGSLFTDETTTWNVGHLPSALSRLLQSTGKSLPGVNSPYLYFGMWRATFAWHVEDMDLFSINYIHFGAPKFWYAIPQGKAVQLENTMRSYFPRDVSQCRQFLRHKSFLASPTLLAQSSCKPNTLVQHAGEFVVTYPRGYHAGFNLGLNCAESVNFALESWLDIGRRAQVCGCVGDSVRIDVDALLLEREREREEAELMADERKSITPPEQSAGPSNPRKRKAADIDTSIDSISTNASKPKPKSRKLKVKQEGVDSAVASASTASSSSSSLKSPMKITLRLAALAPPVVPKDLEPFPCCLCVSRSVEDLLPVQDAPLAWTGVPIQALPKDDVGKLIWRAHESCAMIIPETWVDEVEGADGERKKVVFGVDAIVKDRWHLKCTACQKYRDKAHGAPIQCTKGKCPKAFHVSCARDGQATRFTILQEVEKEVILNEPPPSPFEVLSRGLKIPANLRASDSQEKDSEPTTTCHELVADASRMEVEVSMDDENPMADHTTDSDLVEAELKVIKTIKKLEYECLCSQHNPDVAASKKANKFTRVRENLLSLPPMSRVKLRVTAGVFEVSLLAVHEDRNTVEVIWDGGTKKEFKWGSLVWGKTEGVEIGQKPSEAAPPPPATSTAAVSATPTQASSSQSSPSPQTPSEATPQPALPAATSAPQPGYRTLAMRPGMPYTTYPTFSAAAPAGHFPYNAGPYAYAYPPPGTMPYGTPYAPNGVAPVGTLPYGTSQPSYHPHLYSYQSFQTPANYYVGMYSALNASGAAGKKPAKSKTKTPQPTPARTPSVPVKPIEETIAASVASLPPRAEFASASPVDRAKPDISESSRESSKPRESQEPSASNATSQPKEDTAVSATSPDVLQAVEELTALSNLNPGELTEVLNARPQLREAVKILLAHQAQFPSDSIAASTSTTS